MSVKDCSPTDRESGRKPDLGERLPEPRPINHTMDGTRRAVWPVLLSIAAGVIAPGCKQVEVIPAPGHGLGTVVERLHRPGPRWSVPTTNFLCQLGLDDLARRHPGAAFQGLERGPHGVRPDPRGSWPWRSWPTRTRGRWARWRLARR